MGTGTVRRLSTCGVAPGTFLALLEEPECRALAQLGIRRAFPRGAALMFEHEPGERVMLLFVGRVKVTRAGEEGHDSLLNICDPGDLLGELAFIDGQPRIATVTALEPVEAVVIPAQAFRAHLEGTPRVAVALLEAVTRQFRQTTVRLTQLAASDTMGRVAARIIELAERYGEPADCGMAITSPLSQEELGARTGASRAGVAHALKTLRELGWVQIDRRRILVRDLQALRARAA